MGRKRTTGVSHNRNAKTYKTTNRDTASTARNYVIKYGVHSRIVRVPVSIFLSFSLLIHIYFHSNLHFYFHEK